MEGTSPGSLRPPQALPEATRGSVGMGPALPGDWVNKG